MPKSRRVLRIARRERWGVGNRSSRADDIGISITRAPASSSAFFCSFGVIFLASSSLLSSAPSVVVHLESKVAQIIQGLLPSPFWKFRRSLHEVGRRRWVSMITGRGRL